jgi:hypothetical protein
MISLAMLVSWEIAKEKNASVFFYLLTIWIMVVTKIKDETSM